MALAADSIGEIRNGGSDTLCSGWFANSLKGATGVDYTLQASAQVTCSANLSASGTTTLTATGSPFSNLLLGNTIRISGGTLTTGLYQITAYTDANNVVLDRTPGTGSGSTGYIGGAMATLGQCGADNAVVGASSNGVYVHSGATVSVASTSTNVATGVWSLTTDYGFIVGYDTNRTLHNNDASKPTVIAGVNSLSNGLININGQDTWLIRNLMLDGNRATNTGARAIGGTSGRGLWIDNCTIKSFSTVPFNSLLGTYTNLICTDNTATALAFFTAGAGTIRNCEFYANSADCINFAINSGTFSVEDCLFYDNTGASTDGINISNNAQTVMVRHCVFYNNGGSGISLAGNGGQPIITNNIFVSNGAYGVNASAVFSTGLLRNNAYYNNTSGQVHSNITSGQRSGEITLTGDPFTDAANDDFSINNTANEGALLRGLGHGAFPRGLTTSYPDVGAAQHQEAAAGGGGPLVGPGRLIR